MGADPDNKVLHYRWIVFWILSFGYFIVYFHRLCPAVVAVDMMRDLRAGGGAMGFLGAAYFYPYAVMQLPAGILSDSWGPRKTITLFFAIASLGSLMLGMAGTLFWAVLGRTLVGVGAAMVFVPTLKVIAEWFAPREFTVMTGILMAMGGLGSLTAATPLAFASARVGWRFSFVGIGVFTFIIAGLVWSFVRDRPSDKGLPAPYTPQKPQLAPAGLVEGIKVVLRCPHFWPLAAWFFFACGVFFSFGGLWGGPFLEHIYGLDKTTVGHIFSMIACGMIVGSPLFSVLSNRVFRARKPVSLLSSFLLLLFTGLLAFHTERIPLVGLYLLFFGLGIFIGGMAVIGFTMAKELFPIGMTGTAIGLVNLFPFAGGAIFQPAAGYILERQGMIRTAFTLTGYRQVFLGFFFCAIIASVLNLFIKETLNG